jgi:hypothetical protein
MSSFLATTQCPLHKEWLIRRGLYRHLELIDPKGGPLLVQTLCVQAARCQIFRLDFDMPVQAHIFTAMFANAL